MTQVTNVVEYTEEGIAIIQDTKGKYVASKHTTEITPLYDYELMKTYFGRQEPCALLQSRANMLT